MGWECPSLLQHPTLHPQPYSKGPGCGVVGHAELNSKPWKSMSPFYSGAVSQAGLGLRCYRGQETRGTVRTEVRSLFPTKSWGWGWDVGTLDSPWCSVFQLLLRCSGKP